MKTQHQRSAVKATGVTKLNLTRKSAKAPPFKRRRSTSMQKLFSTAELVKLVLAQMSASESLSSPAIKRRLTLISKRTDDPEWQFDQLMPLVHQWTAHKYELSPEWFETRSNATKHVAFWLPAPPRRR